MGWARENIKSPPLVKWGRTFAIAYVIEVDGAGEIYHLYGWEWNWIRSRR